MKKNYLQQNIVVYIDISEFVISRATTGIQRMIQEFLKRAIANNLDIKVLFFNENTKSYEQLLNSEILDFLQNVKSYSFKNFKNIDIFKPTKSKKIFFDIDVIWNSPLKRALLYPKLNANNFKIVNFIYDLIPVKFSHFFYEKTKNNFAPFLDAVCNYSDLVLLDSNCAKDDFYNYTRQSRDIKTSVVYLGSDFSQHLQNSKISYNEIMSKKYILFVGTIEPRKEQQLLLNAFETLHQSISDLYLVFIGRRGWNVENFLKTLDNHPLRNKYIFYFEEIDDSTLHCFYHKAFLVTYLSQYEGFGLPVVESLSAGIPTIVSKNSSLVEIGKDFVEYIQNSSLTELVNIISHYYQDSAAYKERRNYIQNYYKPPSWDDTYQKIINNLDSI